MVRWYPEAPADKRGWRYAIWKKRMMLSSTLGFSMLQTWETVLVLTLLFALTLIFWLSVFNLYPRYFAYLSRRFSYYVFEDENASLSAALREWAREGVRRVLGSGAAAGGKAKVLAAGEL
ncbi:uncharacterized protein MKK02DRAFT_29723 [Dioszegia hungarica]|uniref:Uncharacterized protein n=1 Tax=Dioszegia hungarica TaxID=4972 RepID=A0AA38HDK2_9TREE|nr:uncharacterized protein MKK02DRAFT_29723 [Dioszegia hungarica]KAI9639728.1 hypothetical protein MKK02DRAFT_29723 [Dioszegia hungarica]